jgi:simple sugar transport system substrate-binding protein
LLANKERNNRYGRSSAQEGPLRGMLAAEPPDFSEGQSTSISNDPSREEQPADRIARPPVSLSRAAVLAAGAGAGLTAAVAAAGGLRSAQAAKADYRFVFVNHVTTNPFFTATQYGATDACNLLGCSYRWSGSETSNVSEMVRAFQTAINNKADGIAVCLVDAQAFNGVVEQAIGAGIPVVAYNADAPAASHNKRQAYIGQDLFRSGQLMGERIAALVPSGGHVALFIATPGSLNIQPRIDGAVDSLKKSGKNISYEQVASGALVTQERSTVESYYNGHKSISGMFAVDGGSTEAIGLTSKKYGLAAKKIATGGYDLLPGTLAAIDAGDLDFTIDQQPYLQGYYPVVQLYLYKASGTLMSPCDTDTGLKFVTKDSVKPYLAAKTRFEGQS